MILQVDGTARFAPARPGLRYFAISPGTRFWETGLPSPVT
jgi:hypothetical protein